MISALARLHSAQSEVKAVLEEIHTASDGQLRLEGDTWQVCGGKIVVWRGVIHIRAVVTTEELSLANELVEALEQLKSGT